MSQEPPEVNTSQDNPEQENNEEYHPPYGAIGVTTVLVLTIAVMWFGIYILNLVRS